MTTRQQLEGHILALAENALECHYKGPERITDRKVELLEKAIRKAVETTLRMRV